MNTFLPILQALAVIFAAFGCCVLASLDYGRFERLAAFTGFLVMGWLLGVLIGANL